MRSVCCISDTRVQGRANPGRINPGNPVCHGNRRDQGASNRFVLIQSHPTNLLSPFGGTASWPYSRDIVDSNW